LFYIVPDFALTPLWCTHSISPESSDGFASVGTILPKEGSRPVAGRLLSSPGWILRRIPIDGVVVLKCTQESNHDQNCGFCYLCS
jgi:hypothetical protein